MDVDGPMRSVLSSRRVSQHVYSFCSSNGDKCWKTGVLRKDILFRNHEGVTEFWKRFDQIVP
jgi:hypothetical protein